MNMCDENEGEKQKMEVMSIRIAWLVLPSHLM